MGAHGAREPHAAVAGLLALVGVTASLALAACGGASISSSTPSTVASGVAASPSVAATPERLVGGDSVAATKNVMDGLAAGLVTQSGAQVAPLYADAVVYDDYTYGLHLEGKTDVLKELQRSLRQTGGVRVLADYAESGWGVLEHRWDFTKAHGVSIQPITICEISDGRIVHEEWWYQDPVGLPSGTPLEPKPLTTAPGPQDTAAVAQAVALEYAAALQARDAARVAALSATSIAFMDTASSTTGGSPGEVRAHYASMFAAPADLAFTNLRYVFGPGWAAVIWTASGGGVDGEGATMLEIRDGKITRETLYYSSNKMPF
jgi:ketosteroid isomerase-like protein